MGCCLLEAHHCRAAQALTHDPGQRRRGFIRARPTRAGEGSQSKLTMQHDTDGIEGTTDLSHSSALSSQLRGRAVSETRLFQSLQTGLRCWLDLQSSSRSKLCRPGKQASACRAPSSSRRGRVSPQACFDISSIHSHLVAIRLVSSATSVRGQNTDCRGTSCCEPSFAKGCYESKG